jgi:hypothetical protein
MLNELLLTFFSTQYNSKEDMLTAYTVCNKKWSRYARKNKLNEKDFEQKTTEVLTLIKKNNGTSNE